MLVVCITTFNHKKKRPHTLTPPPPPAPFPCPCTPSHSPLVSSPVFLPTTPHHTTRHFIIPAGDYDVKIPRGTPPGLYSIRVGRFEDDSLYACSGVFTIVRDSSKFDDDEQGVNRGDFYREGGYADSVEDDGIDYYSSDSYSFSYGFYFEDDDLADEWWRRSEGRDRVNDRVDGRSSGDSASGDSGDSASGDSVDNASVDSVDDDDSVSAGDEVESPPPDGWFWDDDWTGGDDDGYSYGHDDYSNSYSLDFRAEPIAYGWPVGKNAS